MARVSSDPFLTNDLNPTATPGMFYEGLDAWGKPATFRYVQFKDSVAYLAGHIVWPTDDGTGAIVTNTAAQQLGLFVWGICLRVMTENYYGYIQVTGRATVQTDGGVAAGDFLVGHTVDGECDTMADGEEEQVFGVALVVDASDQGEAHLLRCPTS